MEFVWCSGVNIVFYSSSDLLWNENNLSGQMNGQTLDMITLDIHNSLNDCNHTPPPVEKHDNTNQRTTFTGLLTLHEPRIVFASKVCEMPPKCKALQSHFI